MTRMTGTLYVDLGTSMIVSRWMLLRMRNVSEKFVEKIQTYTLCSVILFQK